MAVFHLKYRPQKFKDLDLGDVSEKLVKILSGIEVPQSFLFSGPKGAGKTSAARIAARAVNCLKPIDTEPCGECDNCKEILGGNSIDIIEIDAASNRGIEDVRLLKEKAYLLPSKLKRKVFIIDEVHMLTKEAFNALLKLIEEPPKHTVFILCTTDPEKIPDTVLSRLVKVDFRKGGKNELAGSLQKIIEGEDIKIESQALEMVIANSDGSFRNVQRTFNEIYLQFGKTITTDDVRSFFNNRTGGYMEEDFETDLANDAEKKILEKLEDMAVKGADFPGFREKLLVFFQKKLLTFFGITDGGSSKLGLAEVKKIMNLLIIAGKQEKDVSLEQLPLELAVVEYFGDREANGSNGAKKEKPEELKKEEKRQTDVKSSNKKDSEDQVIVVESDEQSPKIISDMTMGQINLEEVEKGWGKLLLAVKPYNHSVEAFLRAARPKKINGKFLVLEVFYPFHKDRLEEAKNRKIVEEGLTRVFGVDMAFECELSRNKKGPLVIQNDVAEDSLNNSAVNHDRGEEKKDMYDVAKEIFG